MRSFLRALLFLTLTLTAAFSVVKLVLYPPFGPLAIAIVCLLLFLSILFAMSLSFYSRGKAESVLKIWMALGATVITYVLAEFVLSLLLIKPLSPPIVSDPYCHHKFVRNTRNHFRSDEFDYTETINNWGLRGPDIQQNRSPDRYRILALGDSFTMGNGIGDDKTFCALLEKSLNTDRKVEVLNGGVDSYTPILSYFQLTKELAPLKPDLVILNLDISDLVQEAAYRKKARYGDDGEIVGIDGSEKEPELSFRTRFRAWVDKHLYITRTIFFFLEEQEKLPDPTINNVVIRPNFMILRHTLADDPIDRTEQWKNIFASITKIKQYCDRNGIQFLLTIYPWGHQVSDKEWNPGRYRFLEKGFKASDKSIDTIQQFSQENGITLLNLYPAFRSYTGSSPLYYSIDMHWTEAGHKLMARELEQHLRKTVFSQH
jgi:lysophospholipase L1-like esterase